MSIDVGRLSTPGYGEILCRVLPPEHVLSEWPCGWHPQQTSNTCLRKPDWRCRHGRRLRCSKSVGRVASDYDLCAWYRTSLPYEYGPVSLVRAVCHRPSWREDVQPRREELRLHSAPHWPVQWDVAHLHRFPLLWLYNSREGYLEYMEFTAGLGAQDARLTFIPGDNGENTQPGGKKYNRSGNHKRTMRLHNAWRGETSSLHLPQLILLYQLYMLSLP